MNPHVVFKGLTQIVTHAPEDIRKCQSVSSNTHEHVKKTHCSMLEVGKDRDGMVWVVLFCGEMNSHEMVKLEGIDPCKESSTET